jgi:hypothetical protein
MVYRRLNTSGDAIVASTVLGSSYLGLALERRALRARG